VAHPEIDPITDDERARWPATALTPLGKPFKDERGSILPLVDLPMKSAVLIASRAGTVRANHYHQTDWHFCYVVSGRIEYYHRPHGSKQVPERIVVEAGQQIFTPPMVEHAMVFPIDTVFLTLGRNSRRQEVYEADVVRIEPIQSRE
jgi:dTDP-4-dehydrorhamnose 3,5-epimerase-like enzyme